MLTKREKQIATLAYFNGIIGNDLLNGKIDWDVERMNSHIIACSNDILTEIGLKVEKKVWIEFYSYVKEMDALTKILIKEILHDSGN